ncbi:hypothetical protein BV22DRAFT_1039560 [Leucogyrophana mollusca]|uniref:Uncharacterized protein n=1 Tax=Leucogyrophana mollusca TaxID=85980 RepID=A0ACB8B746_9AGAM|nr:hypothetical protein BV22DRAFT_1039560 [Leucogyrophana mollusca]
MWLKCWKRSELQPTHNDSIFKKDDIIIPVLGPMGAGRSTFINIAAGKAVTAVSDGLYPCTTEIIYLTVPCPNDTSRRVIFLDTPGFDNIDENGDASKVVSSIAAWVARSCGKDKKLAGVICLREIPLQGGRMPPSPNYLRELAGLCGKDAYQNIIMATTKWRVEGEVEIHHERELSRRYWGNMIKQGSRMVRFGGTYESAWDIVRPITEGKLHR